MHGIVAASGTANPVLLRTAVIILQRNGLSWHLGLADMDSKVHCGMNAIEVDTTDDKTRQTTRHDTTDDTGGV
jgi:hypothetical protein